MTASRARAAEQPRFEPKSKPTSRQRYASRKASLRANEAARTNFPTEKRSSKSTARANQLPAGLRLLLSLQQISIAATVLLTVAVFGVYSWTVYAQESWNDRYHKLESLKRYERQLTTAEEAINHNLATNVQTMPGHLIREKPEQSLFLEAAPLRPGKTTSLNPTLTKAKPTAPIGY